ncbi:MAG: 50S ribosomal protein L23 [Candidatus Pacebacteria bacterium]|nr:50S ribosomal protein L23 [Candidatus Paceibacterota bacterium]
MAKKETTTKEVVTKDLILKNPLVTEKAARAQSFNTYVFDVATTATKSEIVKAFVAKYKHKPTKVNTVNQSAKSFFRKGKLGFGAKGRKAYITLPKGKTIEVM